ncbi:SseB family protein [Stagnihabitans tardus]|uniref:SseB family protein n=1 Tax=Stagnihabitans tardus TaxID=2699202 RepID=A0AAE5BU54_9RHOB|nr:SseB family protein [Stagnihabitans tardus]NBZ87456.1 SseB family protein [Stagnihabitans tardus]
MTLDAAHQAMEDGGEAEALAFWRAFADAELFLVLEEEAEGATIKPRSFDLSSGPLLLVFDSEERLGTLSADPVPYAALPGRVIAAQLAGQGLGLGLNLGSGAASETILPPASVDWLADMLSQAMPEQASARIKAMGAPGLTRGLAGALAGLLPPGSLAALAAVEYDTGARGHALAVAGLEPAREEGFARAVTEVLAFSGLDAASLDVFFVMPDAPILRRMAEAGQGFAGPARVEAPAQGRSSPAPGMDPSSPPKLR